MGMGIAIMGLNGSGKSTLAHAWAQRTGAFEMDVEDYYFPQQRESRRLTLDGEADGDACCGGAMPFADSLSKEEVQAAILRDVQLHPDFVLSGVTMNWCAEITERIDLAFILQTPAAARAGRIQLREERRFGDRVRPGGDMYAQQMEFRQMAQGRDEGIVRDSAALLQCPVYVLDGTVPVEENVETMLKIVTGMR